MRALERGFSGKCSVQVNQVSITETFNMKNMERRNDQETCQKAEGVFKRRKPSAMLSKAFSRNRQIRLRSVMQIFVKMLTDKTVTFDVEGQ